MAGPWEDFQDSDTAVAEEGPWQYFPQINQLEPGNIDASKRPVVKNSDGTVSTVKTISIGTDKGEVLIPTVVNGKVVTKDEAVQHYRSTGENLGTFATPQDATAFAKNLHEDEAQRTEAKPWEEFKPAPTVQSETLPAVIKDIYQHAGERFAKLGEQLKTEFTSGEAVKPIGGGLPILAHSPDESALGGYARAAYNAPAGLWNAATSPAGLATVGSFALGQPEIGVALIAAQMAPHAGSMIEQVAKAATGQLPPGESAETALNLALIAAPGVHEALPKGTEFKPVETINKPEFPVSQKGITEPPDVPAEFLPEKTSVTADLTRQLIDSRKNLLDEAQVLQKQAAVSQAVTGTIPGEIANRIAAINEELNHPTVGVPVTPETPVEDVLKATTVSPDAVTGAVAQSPASTAAGDVIPGQAATQPSGAVGVGAGPAGATVRGGGGAPVAGGLARSTIEDMVKAGILPPDALVIGKGWNATEAAARGDSLVNQGVNPDAVVTALTNKNVLPKGVNNYGDAVAVLESETRRLAGERAAAQKQFGLGSQQAVEAQTAENNWLRNVRPKAGGLAQQIMVAFQDTTPVDLGKYDDLYKRASQLSNGADIPLGQQIEMMRKTAKVETARTQVGEALGKRQTIVDNTLPKVKTPTKEDMQALVKDMADRLTPCK